MQARASLRALRGHHGSQLPMGWQWGDNAWKSGGWQQQRSGSRNKSQKGRKQQQPRDDEDDGQTELRKRISSLAKMRDLATDSTDRQAIDGQREDLQRNMYRTYAPEKRVEVLEKEQEEAEDRVTRNEKHVEDAKESLRRARAHQETVRSELDAARAEFAVEEEEEVRASCGASPSQQQLTATVGAAMNIVAPGVVLSPDQLAAIAAAVAAVHAPSVQVTVTAGSEGVPGQPSGSLLRQQQPQLQPPQQQQQPPQQQQQPPAAQTPTRRAAASQPFLGATGAASPPVVTIHSEDDLDELDTMSDSQLATGLASRTGRQRAGLRRMASRSASASRPRSSIGK